MKPMLLAQAVKHGAFFSAMGVALDRDLAKALTFLTPNGAFDEYVIGSDLTSLAAERFIRWSHSRSGRSFGIAPNSRNRAHATSFDCPAVPRRCGLAAAGHPRRPIAASVGHGLQPVGRRVAGPGHHRSGRA